METLIMQSKINSEIKFSPKSKCCGAKLIMGNVCAKCLKTQVKKPLRAIPSQTIEEQTGEVKIETMPVKRINKTHAWMLKDLEPLDMKMPEVRRKYGKRCLIVNYGGELYNVTLCPSVYNAGV